MHFFRIFLVIVNAIGWNSLTKICLETIHTHINQCFEFLLIPFLCLRVGKVDDCHARLPHVPLPYRTVRTLQEISAFHALVKHHGFLCNIRINPYTDL